jgi:hypothetical protein
MTTIRIHMTAARGISSASKVTAIATLLAAAAIGGCSRSDTSSASSDSTAAAAPAQAAASTGAPASNTVRLRGNVVAVSDTALDLSSDSGNVHVSIAGPLDVYARVPATLAQVNENSFIGVTSVKQPDGSQRATEIHIFPEKLRGTGEGSRLMQGGNRGGSAGGGNPSTMTNGTVSEAPADSSRAPRMTNGSVTGKPGGTMTVKYQDGTQTITIPSDVSVTAIAPSTTPLAAGANVNVTATRQPDGTLKATFVMLGGGRGGNGRGGRRERSQ